MSGSLNTGTPFVFINDSGGARVQEGVGSLAGYARVFLSATCCCRASVPQISLICGPCAGGAAYSPALTDFIIQTRYAYMFITGPAVIKQVTNESDHRGATGRRACPDGPLRSGAFRGGKRRARLSTSASACCPSCPPTTRKIRRAPTPTGATCATTR